MPCEKCGGSHEGPKAPEREGVIKRVSREAPPPAQEPVKLLEVSPSFLERAKRMSQAMRTPDVEPSPLVEVTPSTFQLRPLEAAVPIEVSRLTPPRSEVYEAGSRAGEAMTEVVVPITPAIFLAQVVLQDVGSLGSLRLVPPLISIPTTLEDLCCCCVEDLHFEGFKGEDPDKWTQPPAYKTETGYGHTIHVVIQLKYKKAKASKDCKLEWWEMSPTEYAMNEYPNRWVDMVKASTGVNPEHDKYHPVFGPWINRKMTCNKDKQEHIPPPLSLEDNPRWTLSTHPNESLDRYFFIRVFSAEGCDCKYPSLWITATQRITIKGGKPYSRLFYPGLPESAIELLKKQVPKAPAFERY